MRVLNILSIIGGLFFAWVAVSWLEIICNNLAECTYSAWNFFTLLIK